MSKLGIKIVLSYISLAIIATVVFFITIKNTISNNIISPDNINTSKIVYDSIYSGFLFTMLISLVISLAFEMSIVAPIANIRKNINIISLDNKLKDWKKVDTDDELEYINEELYTMTIKLQEANKHQKEFFQNTSHELKTPLMSIQGYAEAIKDGVLEDDDMQYALDIIIDESKNLSETITSILYLSSIDKLTTYNIDDESNINMYEKVEELKTTFEYRLLDKNIKIVNNFPENLIFKSSRDKIDKIINNLFTNSLRYAKSKITFSFYADSNNVYFTISDDGKGFDENNIDKIFERFYKGADGKSGLGLSIVKAIVDSLNCEIRAYNSMHGGAAIEIKRKRDEYVSF